MRALLLLTLAGAVTAWAHDAHGRSNAPAEARRLKSPFVPTAADLADAEKLYASKCASCHGPDGRSRTEIAGKLKTRPTDLSTYLMESMKDGEIFWVIQQGINVQGDNRMPAFGAAVSDQGIWRLVFHVRALREKQRAVEKAKLGPYEWSLPPGFPFPNIPASNPMTQEKVELGRRLFYDKRFSANQTQSCASCHKQELAFTDGRARALGSTGQVHPRASMGLFNVAYNPVLTWANPNMRELERQALVPIFGDHPIELGMTGKEDLLLQRLQALPIYRKLFAAAFPADTKPVSVANATKAIASFQRTLLSGDSPYDEYRRGDDPNAISASAKRGEELFFSERLECFHCHGGFNFTGTVDYLGKGFAEVEFHNTGLYNLPGDINYPLPNTGLFEFTQQADDVGKFKAPSLRNVAVTAPYMHDGSVKTLADAIDHYAAGGRKIASGPRAGNGFDNPNKSEFVKSFDLTPQEKRDLIAFLESLTDRAALANPAYADPWQAAPLRSQSEPPRSKYTLRGEVARIYPEDGAIALYHDEVPGFMTAMRAPQAMEFLVHDPKSLATLQPGMAIHAGVRKRGSDYILEFIQPIVPPRNNSKRNPSK
jgi:cytochrome c peroxidase